MARLYANLAFATLSLLAVVTTPSKAADPAATALFADKAADASAMACFRLVRDKAWMDAHPQSNVKSMAALIARRTGDDPAYVWHDANLLVSFADSATDYRVTGGCGDIADNGLGCGVDCDGGGFDLAIVSNSQIKLTIGGSLRYEYITDTVPSTVTQGFKAEDKSITLARTELADCLPLISDDTVKAEITRTLAH